MSGNESKAHDRHVFGRHVTEITQSRRSLTPGLHLMGFVTLLTSVIALY